MFFSRLSVMNESVKMYLLLKKMACGARSGVCNFTSECAKALKDGFEAITDVVGGILWIGIKYEYLKDP